MKKILFALSFALSVPACMTTPPPDGAVEPPQTRVEASPLTSPAPLDQASCLQACDEANDTCLGNAVDSFEQCQCDNQLIACERGCGVFHPFHQC